ncbi:uncharacterized protein TNCV_453151 [Trichonephila clavipes]|nr:uncharacterized protein TNCV_453151 [Trichonephila clavipes]
MPGTSSSVSTVSTSSSSTQEHLLPSPSAIIPTIQKTETRSLTTPNKFAALSTEIQPLVLLPESVPTTSNSEHSNALDIPQCVKRNSRITRKCPKVQKPEIEKKMAPHSKAGARGDKPGPCPGRQTGYGSDHILFKSIKEDSSRRFTLVHDGPNRCLPRAHFNDRGARDAARETRRIGICSSAGTSLCLHHLPGTQHETCFFVLFCKDNWYQKKTLVDNFKCALLEAKHVNEFRPDDVLWEKISKGLLRNPDRTLKNTDKRMVYIYYNMLFMKKYFTFGFRTVKSGEIHLIQTTNVPMLIYEFPSSSLRCRASPNLFRRSFEPFDQMLYHRMVLEPHTVYPIPAGTRYILLTVQKTVFGLDIIPETILPQLMENGFNLGDFRKMKRYDQKACKLPPPTPAHVPAEKNKRPLEEQPGPSSKRSRVFITPVIRPPVAPVLIARPSTALATPQPVIIPEPPVLTTPQTLLPDPPRPPDLTTPLVQILVFQPPVQIPLVPTTPPVQLFLPDPPPVQVLLPDPPVVETLEPTVMDDSSIYQIMSSVFGDCSQQGLPPAHTQEPQLLDTVPSLFDESNDLLSFLDHFETGLAIEQQETPMDLTMPRLKKRERLLGLK